MGVDEENVGMPGLTPRRMLDAIDEGLKESALLVALGYDSSQGRPGRTLLNNALERPGYGRPISEQPPDSLKRHQPYPDGWIRDIANAVTGRPNAPIREIIVALKRDSSRAANPSG
jgi:hypothetical protein